jgi:signal transduction histidine kinase
MAYGPEELVLSIVDDGGDRLGLPGEATPHEVTARRAAGPGNGLVGMRERVAVHGGRFRAGSRLDGGWSVEVTIPVREPAAREPAAREAAAHEAAT